MILYFNRWNKYQFKLHTFSAITMEKKCKIRRYVVDHFRSVYLLSKRTHEGKIALKTQSIILYKHDDIHIEFHNNCTTNHTTYFLTICVVHVIYVFLFKDVKALILISSLTGWEVDRDPLYPFYRSYNLLPHVSNAYTDIYPGGRSDGHE